MLESLWVLLNQHGFVEQAMITSAPPPNAIQGPEVVTDMAQLYELGFYKVGEEWAQVGPRPSADHSLDQINKAWFVDIEAMKQAKRDQINRARWEANSSSFTFAGKQIAADRLSRSDIDGVSNEVALTGNLPSSFPNAWKAIDNTYVSIPDVATWVAFVQAMVAQGSANFAHAQQLKAQLDSATTMEQVAAIQWGPSE